MKCARPFGVSMLGNAASNAWRLFADVILPSCDLMSVCFGWFWSVEVRDCEVDMRCYNVMILRWVCATWSCHVAGDI